LITNLFRSAKQTLIVKPSRIVNTDDIKRYNLILVGGKSVNIWTRRLGEDLSLDEPNPPDQYETVMDAKTGQIDMTDYKYRPRSKDDGSGGTYVNFDYGFWDEASHCFWHANHKRYKDPAKNAASPMEVFQSTKEHFIAGYKDFDRAVFCIAKAENYDPGLAAISHGGAH
jgi:hypothetical protein